jgi:hypothetical protein
MAGFKVITEASALPLARAQVVDFQKERQPVVEIHDLWRFLFGAARGRHESRKALVFRRQRTQSPPCLRTQEVLRPTAFSVSISQGTEPN